MVNNGQVAWNMSAEDLHQLQRETAPTYLCQVVLPEKMIKFGKEEPKCTCQKHVMKIAQNGLIATYASLRYHLGMHVV